MITAYGFVLAAFAVLILLAYLAARHRHDLRRANVAWAGIRELDIEAFRNLVSPEEEEFLRSELSPAEFKKIKRERAQAALAYVKVLSNASLQLAQFGGAAQRNADPVIATSGREIADSAATLRLQTLKATVNLKLAAAFPSMGPRPLASLLDQCDRAVRLTQSHNVLQRARSRVA